MSERPPELLGDPYSPEDGVWLRADGRTRGQAQAALASEIGCDFTDLRVTTEWLYLLDPAGPTMYLGRRGDGKSIRYFKAVYESPYERSRRRAAA